MVAVTKCAPGKRFVPPGNGKYGRCEPCPSGTFNDGDDHSTQCTKVNACADSKMIAAGTTSKDAVCTPGVCIHMRDLFHCL